MSYINIGLSTSGSENQAANVPDPLTIGTVNAGTANVTVSNVVSGTVYSLNGMTLSGSLTGSRGNILSVNVNGFRTRADQYINVKDFGAVGDGVTNDTTAISAVLAQRESNGASSQVFFPAGNYVLSSSTTFSSAIKFDAGAKIRLATGITLTISGNIEAVRSQIFENALANQGTVTFADGCPVNEIYPEWFGALGNGQSFTVTTVNGQAGITGSTGNFTSDMIGRPVVLFDQTLTTQAFVSTVSSVQSNTLLTMGSNCNRTLTSKQGIIASDDSAALRAAIVASRGGVTVTLAPNRMYGLASGLYIVPSTGRGLRFNGNNATLVAVSNTLTGGLVTSDPGSNTNVGTAGVDFRNLIIDGANCGTALIGLNAYNAGFPTTSAGFTGKISNIKAQRMTGKGMCLKACQEANFDSIKTNYTADVGLNLISCNASSFFNTVVANTLGASADGIVIDSSTGGTATGGGDVYMYDTTVETITGNGIVINDSVGNVGSPVVLIGGHLEGISKNGFWNGREGTVIRNFTISGPGSVVGYYPIYCNSGSHGVETSGIMWASFNTGATFVESGVVSSNIGANFNSTTNVYTDVSASGGWVDKYMVRKNTGDQWMQGKLFVGTTSPTQIAPVHSIEVQAGSARLGKGHILQDVGEFSNPYGGIGLGYNGLVRSEEFGNASWTKSSVTVTTDAAAAPFAAGTGSLADRLSGSVGGALVRQNVLSGVLGVNPVSGSTFLFSTWMRSLSGVTVIRLGLENTIAGVGSTGTATQDWTVGTDWVRGYVSLTSANASADGIRSSIQSPSASWDIYAWGAQLESFTASYGIEQRHPGPYAKTLSTSRTTASNGPVFNSPPSVPGGLFTFTAGTGGTTVNDSRVGVGSKIQLIPVNSAAAALIGSGTYLASRSLGTSFTFGTAPGVSAAGTERFEYLIFEGWTQ